MPRQQQLPVSGYSINTYTPHRCSSLRRGVYVFDMPRNGVYNESGNTRSEVMYHGKSGRQKVPLHEVRGGGDYHKRRQRHYQLLRPAHGN